MIPAQFDYVAAESAAHALDLMASLGNEAKLLAGGHSLLPMMKLRLVSPTALIDLGQLSELAGLSADGDELVIGAMTRHADLAASELARSDAPLLAHAAAQVGDPQIRHRGTIGGSLAHADPAADLPMALLALGGSVQAQGPRGTRRIAADDFFTGFFETSLAPDELLTAVRVPRRPGAAWGYQKFVRRANGRREACRGRHRAWRGHTRRRRVPAASRPRPDQAGTGAPHLTSLPRRRVRD